MTKVRRLREPASNLPTPAELENKAKAGWRLVALEWERTLDESEHQHLTPLEVPFGLRVAKDGTRLEEDPTEIEVLVLAMELAVREYPFAKIADELNGRGYRRRDGSEWGEVSVFNLLPRLIEVGPEMFSTDVWAARRKYLSQLYSAM